MGSRQNYVYLYRNGVDGPIVYVGKGVDETRAMAHRTTGHNRGLAEWLDRGSFSLEIAGPYDSEREALRVEAALISALHPRFNKATGDGPTFRPLGVPAALAGRVAEPPLTLDEIAARTGGGLIVYIAPGKVMADGRPKFDPASPDPAVVATDVEGWWQIDRHVSSWATNPESGPQVLVGAYGSLNHRFVIGAFDIDTARWGLGPSQDRKEGGLWKVPLLNRSEHDAAQLCGRRIEGLRFGRSRAEHFRAVLPDRSTRSPER